MCLYPRFIKNRRYLSNKKNGGNIPPVTDERTLYVPIGCQECIECRKQKAREWQVRLLEDIKTNKNGKFITLTLSNQQIKNITEGKDIDGKQVREPINPEITGYELDNEIATQAVRYFLERWRKKYKKSLRHWLVTELGHNGTENIHLHGIVWTDTCLREVEKIWGYGFIWKGHLRNGSLINYVNGQTVTYITKYVHKIDVKHKLYKSKILTSPGIGNHYTLTHNSKRNKFKGKDTYEVYKTGTGHEMAMPIYWRNKIYTEKEREQLWLQRLDKMERWVCGERVDLNQKNGYEIYDKLLSWHRKINTQLGYGNGEKNWSRHVYERERRKILHATRIAAAESKIRPSASST